MARRPGSSRARAPLPAEADTEPTSRPVARRHLTREARALLRQADEGGVPMFVSQSLRRIAEQNGVDVTEDMTPNAIVDALRARAAAGHRSALD